MFDVVILAGGKGKRIQKLSKKYPKPYIHYNGKPFINYLINNIAKYNISNIFILAGYKGKYIYRKYNNKFQNLVKIKCLIETTPRDTGGALYKLKNKIKNDFIVINGDTFFDVDYFKIFNKWKKIKSKKNINSLLILKKIKKVVKLKNINIKNKKIFFGKKNYLINGGIYFFKKKFIKKIINKKISLENYYISKEIKKSRVEGHLDNSFFIDIGTPKDFMLSQNKIISQTTKPAAFFDRDNVLIHDRGYVYKKKDLKFKNGVINALKYLIKKNYYIFIVTNQAGIGKKKFSLDQFINFQKFIKFNLLKKKITLDDIKFCPHHPDAIISKYKINCKCRKPGNLMIQVLKKNWNIKISKSFMIGDKMSDEIAAKKSNLYFEYGQNNLLKQVTKIYKEL